MATSVTCLPKYLEFIDWNQQPRFVINAHSPLRSIQDGGRRNFEEAERPNLVPSVSHLPETLGTRLERPFIENRKKISLLGKAFF